MDTEEFEKLWQVNKAKILANDEEYQHILRTYMGWGWMDYLILIGGFVICENFFASLSLHIVLEYVLALIGMVVIWLGFRLIKGWLGGRKTLAEVELQVKERYRKSLKN
ncbi:MAG: Fis family transcriptional regulator [Prevotella sp.]|nr:Fis family transcriptional regulator [Prevotella sp.]MDY4217224.1 Fis family transcriptional regulator [Prevotella sp.]